MVQKSVSAVPAVAFRDDLTKEASVLVQTDPDGNRAWTIDQALSAYKRNRVRLLKYIADRKQQEKV